MLQKLLTGNPFCIIAHDMGLGKTAVAIAVVWTSALMIKEAHRWPADKKYALGYLDPTVLTNLDPEMGDAEHRLEAGPTLVVSTPKLRQVWVQEIRQFLRSRMNIVLAGSKNLGAEEKAFFFTQHNCFAMSTEIVEDSMWYPSDEQLQERYTSKGYKILEPFLVTDLLIRRQIINNTLPCRRPNASKQSGLRAPPMGRRVRIKRGKARCMFLVVPAENLGLGTSVAGFQPLVLDQVPECLFERLSDRLSASGNGFLHIRFALGSSRK